MTIFCMVAGIPCLCCCLKCCLKLFLLHTVYYYSLLQSAIVSCSEAPQLTPRNSVRTEPDPSLHKPPAEAASPEDQAPATVPQPHLVSSGSTGSNDSCTTAAVLPSRLSEQQGKDTALATDSTPAATSSAAASGQGPSQVTAALRNTDAVTSVTPAVASSAAVAPPYGKGLVDKVSVAMSEAAPLQPKATPGAAIGTAKVTDESLAHWVKLPQHRLKGRAAADKPSAEQPWQVRTHGLLRCAVLCCAVLCCAVLCCAALCCAVLCCAVLCWAVLCCAGLGWAGLRCAVLRCAALCCAALRCAAMLFSAAQPWLLLLLQSCHHCLLQAHS